MGIVSPGVMPTWSLFLFIGIIVGILIHKWCLRPFSRIRPLGTVQFKEIDQQLQKPGAKSLFKGRRIGDFPPPYPNGWFLICFSDELERGGVKQVNVLGKQFALWRDSKGKAHLFDAFCPHLGANLGFGGTVKEDCLECPFHGWSFDGTGQCVKIPYAKDPCNVPSFAKIETHTIYESNNLIFYWNDAENRSPLWYPPDIPDINAGRYTCHGKTEHHVGAHIQELPENGADIAHLNVLHGQFIYPAFKFMGHKWEAFWEPLEGDKKHCTKIKIIQDTTIFGYKLPGTHIEVDVNQVGPGLVYFQIHTNFGKAYLFETVTPIAPMLQKTHHIIFGKTIFLRPMYNIFLNALARQYERDVPIWQWKTFLKKPMLVKEDNLIVKFRKWFSQFYSERSLSFSEAVEQLSQAQKSVPEWQSGQIFHRYTSGFP